MQPAMQGGKEWGHEMDWHTEEIEVNSEPHSCLLPAFMTTSGFGGLRLGDEVALLSACHRQFQGKEARGGEGGGGTVYVVGNI